jgi:hypothetical protein
VSETDKPLSERFAEAVEKYRGACTYSTRVRLLEIVMDRSDTIIAALREREAGVIGNAAAIQSARDMREVCAKVADDAYDKGDKASRNNFDGGAGQCGYEMACRDIEAAIRALPIPGETAREEKETAL